MSLYPELEIGLHRWDATAWTVDLRFTDPDSDGFDSSVTSTSLVDFEQLRELAADEDSYGALLGEGLLGNPEIRERFASARAISQTRRLPLRIRFFVGPSAPELHSLRWETLREPQDRNRLLTDDHLLFSRFLSSIEGIFVPLRPRAELRALVVIASPSDLSDWDLGALDVEAELHRAQLGLGGIPRSELPGEGQGGATLNNIIARLRDGYDILYLVCHGTIRSGEPRLWLEGPTGSSRVIAGRELADRLRELSNRPRLVVLASCQSAGTGDEPRGSDEGALAALGPRLARAGIPAVVAMQGNVTKPTIDTFMETFFAELQRDGQVDRAVTVARGAVLERSDWWMPVLFMALRSGRIWYEPGFEQRVDAGPEEMEKWPALLRAIHDGRCTPILGPGMAESLLGTRREIAMRWASTYRYPMASFSRSSLPQVAQYLAVRFDDKFTRAELREHLRKEMLTRYGDDLPAQVRDRPVDELIRAEGRRRRENDPLEPHKVLAGLPFRLYVTAGVSDLLEDALYDAHRSPEQDICRWNEDLDLPPPIYEAQPDYYPSVEHPFVYHAFGKFSEPDSLVLTEDDYFDFLIGVTRNNEMIPSFVRRTLAKTALLFLGFRLDEWEFRVLYRSLMSQEGRNLRKGFSHVAVQIDPEEGQVPDPEGARRYLASYFQNDKITIYWGSTESFVKELQERLAGVPA